MASLDVLLTALFGSLGVVGAIGSVLSFRKALHVAGERDGDLKMFFWAVGGLTGLIVAGMSTAYFLLPILFNTLR
jgi:hypothetical protein